VADLDEAHNDDISQILILNKKSIANYETQLFEQELEKFRPHQNRLIQANHKQSALMKELTSTFNKLLQDKRVQSEQNKYETIQRQRSSVINRYKRAYQEFLDLVAGLQSAKNWYSEMRETVESLEKNVETFVNNRRSEGAQLLNQIEQDRSTSKNSHAEMERERLRELMDRMSMDPSKSASPQPQATNRPTPAPVFQQGQGPRYTQSSFPGQYQVPSSPPPNQQTMPGQQGYQNFSGAPTTQSFGPAPINTFVQPTYNPSQYATSPPPNQTSFSMGGYRGAASPPPNQTTFGHQAHQSFGGYGASAAPQQTQGGYVPPGFVPPPPPPGPPPLGPQQTFHYGSQEFPNSAHPTSAAPQSAAQQQPHDPWAGLNAWK
jgi:hypothetical protein